MFLFNSWTYGVLPNSIKLGLWVFLRRLFVKWRQINLVQIYFLLDIKSDVTLLIMFLKKSSEMLFRRKPSISVALHAQKLYCKINKSKSRAKASRKPLKESFQKIFSKVLREQRAKSKILRKRILKKTAASSLFSQSFPELVLENCSQNLRWENYHLQDVNK